MDPETQNFTQAGEKMISYEAKEIIWCNNMDVIAIISSENALELYRVSLKTFKIFQTEELSSITHGIFSPDGSVFAMFCEDGSAKMVKTENGEVLYHVKKHYHQISVNSASWIDYTTIKNKSEINQFKESTLLDQLILPVGPHIFSDKNNLARLNYFNEISENFSLMVTSDIAGNIVLTLNGVYPVARLSLSKCTANSLKFEASQYEILQPFFQAEAEKMHILAALKGVKETSHLCLFAFDTRVLHYYKPEITQIGYLMGYLDELLVYIHTTFKSVTMQLKDVQKSFNSKISILEDCLQNHNSNAKPTEEFLRYLRTGSLSTPLNIFFGKELYDCKILHKMDETIYSCFSNMQDLILESVLNSLEKVIVFLNRLEKLSTQSDKYVSLGLQPGLLKKMGDILTKLHFKSDKLLNDITDAKINIRNLIVWMNKCVIRSNDSETEIENTKSHLTKYSFDVDKLYRWLSSDSLFNLKHLFAYFSDTLSDPKYTLKQNASLNILQPRRPQMGQEEEDPVIRNLDDTITKAFANFSAQIFAETQGPIVDTYKAPKLDNHYTQLFQHLPDTNLKSLLTSLDEIWNVVYHKPAEVIAAHITHKITLDLGLIDPNYSVISYSPQKCAEESIEVGYVTQLANESCYIITNLLEVGDNMEKSTTIGVTMLQIDPEYELKGASFMGKGNLLTLLRCPLSDNDKPHSLVGLVETSEMQQIQINSASNTIDLLQELMNLPPNELQTNPLVMSKKTRIDTANTSRLRSSLRGLFSVVSEENKINFFFE